MDRQVGCDEEGREGRGRRVSICGSGNAWGRVKLGQTGEKPSKGNISGQSRLLAGK